jgi:hypothetical protein
MGPVNYRGISLLSVLDKMFTEIMADGLSDRLRVRKVLEVLQAGFVK